MMSPTYSHHLHYEYDLIAVNTIPFEEYYDCFDHRRPFAFIMVYQGACRHHNNHHFDPHWLVFQVYHDPNIGHLQVCQGTCLCSPSTEGYGKGKVLYCYGEVDSILNRISKILHQHVA